MRTAFGYIRRSSYKQQENNSVEIQKQHIQEFAKRNQLNVPDEFIFIEDVTSAYSKEADQRKVLMRLGEKMIEMNVSILIFHDISRMDRTGYSFTLDFYRPLLKELPHLKVYTTQSNEPIDPDDMNIKMNFLLYQHESEVKSERAINSLISDLNQEMPNRPGSRTPFGYAQINKKLIPDSNAKIVAFIYFLYSWGQSLQKIALLLNKADISPPKGTTWRSSTIGNILNNPVYTGNLTWEIPKLKDGQKIFNFENTHEPITNNFYLQLHKRNKMLQNKYGRIDTPFLFLNKIKCRDCHQLLTTQNGSTTSNGKKYQYLYYVCKKCNYKVDALDVHKKLIPEVLRKVQNLVKSNQTKSHSLNYLSQMKNETEREIQQTNEILDNLSKKLAFSREINDRELKLQIVSLVDQNKNSLDDYLRCKDRLKKIILGIESDQFFTRFSDILKYKLGLTEKRLILLYFVDFVYISSNQNTYVQYKENYFEDLN